VLDPYYNITGILGSNFSYKINGLIPPDTWDLTLSINNVSTTTAYDVVTVFERLYGKSVVNKDGWIDIYQPFDTDPIIAFRKEDPNRAFPPGTDTEQLLLKYPAGAGPLINFFILAHLPGNTGGVYDLYEWTQVGELTNDHGFATLSVKVKDWQNDVSAVYVDTRAFNGEITAMSRYSADTWRATIQNTEGAHPDTYNVTVMAISPSDPAYNYFEIFQVTVEFGVTIFGDDIDIAGDTAFDFTWMFSSGHHSLAAWGNNFYLAFTSKKGVNEGAIYFTRSTDCGVTWSNAVALTPVNNGVLEDEASIAARDNNVYIAYTFCSSPKDVYLLSSDDYGASWDSWIVTEAYDFNCYHPSVCAGMRDSQNSVYVAFIREGLSGDMCCVAHAYSPGIDEWDMARPNDHYAADKDIMMPSIAYDYEFNHVLITWFDENPVDTGTRVLLDVVDDDEYDLPTWNADLIINDWYSPGDFESEPSIVVQPGTQYAGIVFTRYHGGQYEIRFVKIDHEDLADVRISPSDLVSTIENYISTPSVACEPLGKWLVTWIRKPDVSHGYECYMAEANDGGTYWYYSQFTNDVRFSDTFHPSVAAANGTDVCVAWYDYRSGRPEIWVDHGTH
jgi:hypothetical protein